MCEYNRWMNERLFAVCATIPDEIRKEDKGAFFRSIYGTLNHLLLGDKLWLGRFLNEPFTVKSLDQELHNSFVELRQAREETDDIIDKWAKCLTDEKLSIPLTFQSAAFGREFTLPLWLCVIHFFNHQTHHRGQLTTLLNQSGYDSGNMDLMWLPLRDSLPNL